MVVWLLGVSTQLGNLTHLPEPKLPTTQTNHFDDQQQVATHWTRLLWVGCWVSSPKTQATQPDHETKKIRWYSKVFWRKFTKTGDIWSFSTMNYSKSTRSNEFWPNHPGKYWPNLNWFGLISTLAAKPETDRYDLKPDKTRTGRSF